MNGLNLVKFNGQFLADSREVATMTNVRHADLLEKIGGYVHHLTNGNFRSLDFFIESTYQDGKGEIRPRYLLTRKGCDMVANKMSGEKGVLFTAAYVSKFEEMEKQQTNIVPLSERQALIQTLKLTAELAEEMDEVKSEIQQLKEAVNEQITIDHGEQRRVQKAVARRIYEMTGNDLPSRREMFQQVYREIKDRWAVASYRDIRRNEIDQVIQYINAWMPRKVS